MVQLSYPYMIMEKPQELWENHRNTEIIASGPKTSWQIDGETVETVADFIFGGSKITADQVTAAMKLKATYSLEGKL